MREKLTLFFASRRGIVLVGGVIGLVAMALQYLGNPPNRGVCVACFERDLAGALGLHRAGPVQDLRPEIPAFVLGSFSDLMLARSTHVLRGVVALVVLAAQPVSHSNHRWNILGMVLAGLCFAMAGGCPGRRLILAGEGDGDAGMFVLGMIGGAGSERRDRGAARSRLRRDARVRDARDVGGLT